MESRPTSRPAPLPAENLSGGPMTSTLGNEKALVPGLAQHLSRCKEAIIGAWTEAVRSDPAIPSAAPLSQIDFLDHIPGILDSLNETLLKSPRHAEERTILRS